MSQTNTETTTLSTDGADSPLTVLDEAFAQMLNRKIPADDGAVLLAALASHQYTRGHAFLDLKELRKRRHVAMGWSEPYAPLSDLDVGAAARSLPWATGENSPLVLSGERLYLRRNWDEEQFIRSSILSRLKLKVDAPQNTRAVLDELFGPAQDGPPDWQKIACAIAAKGQFSVITGGPGTGKTTTVVRLLALLASDPALSQRMLHIELAAPTGKATARLAESIANSIAALPERLRTQIPFNAQTLHRLLGVKRNMSTDPLPVITADVVIVDEASMIDIHMMDRLLRCIPKSTRLILLGDKDQLASVEAGAIMSQLCERADAARYDEDTCAYLQDACGYTLAATQESDPLDQQIAMLRVSRRFDAKSGIGHWARHLNLGQPIAERQSAGALWAAAPLWPSQNDVAKASCGKEMTPLLKMAESGWADWLSAIRARDGAMATDEDAAHALGCFAKFQVLAAVREGAWGVSGLNQRLAAHLGFPARGWYDGRAIIVTKNDHSLGLMNGDIGITMMREHGLKVAFHDGTGGIRWVSTNRLENAQDVLAMTVHKSQGSEFETIAFVLPESCSPILTSELIYTAVTRAKKRLWMVASNPTVLEIAAKQRVDRCGGLDL